LQSVFDLPEATIALACSDPDISHTVQSKREIGRLWEDIAKAPYKALFNSSLSSIRLWRLVQILRAIDAQLSFEQNSRKGRDGMFAVHGNRFLTRQVYKRLPLQSLEEAGIDMSVILEQVKRITPRATELTISVTNKFFPDSYLASLFKNLNRCRHIDEKVEHLWKGN
jgi:hypothetical protein